MNMNHTKYIKLAPDYTKEQIAEKLNLNVDTIRKYQRVTGVKYKPTKHAKLTLPEWEQRFKNLYHNTISIANLTRNESGHIKADMRCLKCGYAWNGYVTHKIKSNSGCAKCDKGNYGNQYTHTEVTQLLNKYAVNHWKLVEYNTYSKSDNIIQCLYCNTEKTVNLSDMINTQSMRCTTCETGSYGEFVIATTLLVNHIEFEREFLVTHNGRKYRIDFMIGSIGLEYNGMQHYEEGLYYNPKINDAMIIKKQWCDEHNVTYIEMMSKRTMTDIINDLSRILDIQLQTPTPEQVTLYNPEMLDVLEYMKTHSARQTMKDLSLPVTKLRKYVELQGYSSISEWQNENKT